MSLTDIISIHGPSYKRKLTWFVLVCMYSI